MSIKKKAIESINDIQASVDDMLIEIDSLKGMASGLKKDLKEDLIDIVLGALEDAKHSLESDKDNPYFLIPLTVALIIYGEVHGKIGQTKYTSELKSGYAKKRLEKDPKQQEKTTVKQCWEAWQIKPDQYKNNTKFANAMIDKFRPNSPDEDSKHLSSVKVITDWCREWKASK